MTHHLSHIRRGLPLVLIGFVGLLWLPSQTVQAAPKYGNSLDLIPADAAFYSASLRLREQVEIVAKSNAWAKLTSLPSVQLAWQFIQLGMNSPGGPGDQINEFFADPDNKELRDLLVDGVSHEIFVYGDRSATDFIDIVMRTINAIQYASMVNDLEAGDDENVPTRIILNALDSHRERLSAPGLVFGLKLTEAKRAQNQLDRLEKLVKPMLEQEPKLRGRLKRVNVGGTEFLTLELDGSMVPWDEVPWKELEEKPGQYDALKTKLHELRLVVSIGVQNDYLLVAVGDSAVKLAALGKGKLLADLPELVPLTKFADKKLTGVSYVSKAMLLSISNTNRDLDQLVQVVRQVLPEFDLPEELNKRILKDAEELVGDLKGIVPEPGAEFSFSFLTPQGFEGYHYDWSQNLYADGSKPLDLLDHVGGNPLLAAVGRAKYSPQQYESFRKWVKKAFGYFEDLAIPEFDDEEKDQYKKIKEAALPLVDRLDKATSQMLLPALADGQSALVLDAKLTSKNWFEALPQGDKSLPMLEAAIVFGVSDATLLQKACAEYTAIADATVEIVRKFAPDEVPPDFKLPKTESSEIKVGSGTGTVSWYKLPSGIGIDPQLTPNAGLTQRVAVLSLAPKHTARLLADTPLAVTPNGPLADRKKPLAGAVYFNWAGLVDAITPWVDLAVHHVAVNGVDAAGIGLVLMNDDARNQLAAAEDDNPSAKMILDQVHTVLDVLKCLRTVESATYVDGTAMVTHSMSVFQDVP